MDVPADRYFEPFESVPVDVAEEFSRFHVVPLDQFAAVDELSAGALLGDDENTILAAGGTLAFYGDGGAGKTTLEVDLAFHLAAGRPWLGLPVPEPLTVARDRERRATRQVPDEARANGKRGRASPSTSGCTSSRSRGHCSRSPPSPTGTRCAPRSNATGSTCSPPARCSGSGCRAAAPPTRWARSC